MIPKRPRDPNELAKAIIDIATGERPDVAPDDKDPAAVQRGLHPLRLRSSVGKYGATRREVDVKGGYPDPLPMSSHQAALSFAIKFSNGFVVCLKRSA